MNIGQNFTWAFCRTFSVRSQHNQEWANNYPWKWSKLHTNSLQSFKGEQTPSLTTNIIEKIWWNLNTNPTFVKKSQFSCPRLKLDEMHGEMRWDSVRLPQWWRKTWNEYSNLKIISGWKLEGKGGWNFALPRKIAKLIPNVE